MRQKRAQKKKSNKRWLWILTSIITVIGIVAIFLVIYFNEKETVPLLEEQNSTSSSNVTSNQSEQPDEQPDESSPITPEQPTDEKIPESKQGNSEQTPDIKVDEGGYAVVKGEVSEPTYIDGVLVANKKYPLPKTYNPGEDPEAKKPMDQMVLAAKDAGFSIVAFSSFRSYEYQQGLYDRYVARDGQEKADRYSARPGHSEHQTGLAFDVGEVGREDLWLTSKFGETAAGKWLAENAHQYGFILRYPKGKEAITGFMYESWHFRYLGVELATKVHASGLTLEEYLNIE